jgi:hypothetical protein
MSKEFGAWELTILDVKVCKPRKNIKVIAKHPLLDTYTVKFDCKHFYEYTYDEKEEKYRFALTDINRMRFGKTPSTSAVMRSFEQFGVPVEGLYKLAVYYCSRKGADVEYSIFIFLFHRMVRRIKRALKLKAKEALHIL